MAQASRALVCMDEGSLAETAATPPEQHLLALPDAAGSEDAGTLGNAHEELSPVDNCLESSEDVGDAVAPPPKRRCYAQAVRGNRRRGVQALAEAAETGPGPHLPAPPAITGSEDPAEEEGGGVTHLHKVMLGLSHVN